VRLWSLHPKYLDAKGLVALWREALLAQAVLAGATRGYTHHPQLTRFRESPAPRKAIAVYLRALHAEAVRRGYHFDAGKIGRGGTVAPLMVTRGQLAYERAHLARKLRVRAPDRHRRFVQLKRIEPHPLFRVKAGGVAAWEIVDER
jgi:Pyrimidine dimer DNA glycosylase